MSNKPQGLSYRDAGVDIAAADAFVSAISRAVKSTHNANVLPDPGAYASLFKLDTAGMAEPALAAACDGVGTKLLIAKSMRRYHALGQDLVAMNVNDLVAVGARPLFFLDYLATGKIDKAASVELVEGIAAACKISGCALLGGETAEMPGLYKPGEFDIAGFAVGIVDRKKQPDSSSVEVGDQVFALPSSGVHSNGFSLARKALFDVGGLTLESKPAGLTQTLGDELLTPTELYVQAVLALMSKHRVKSTAHITGGGLLARGGRLVRDGKAGEAQTLVLNPKSYKRPAIFDLIASSGGVSDHDMASTFNMGIGFLVVLGKAEAQALGASPGPWIHVGEVAKDQGHRADLGYARG